MLDNTGLSLPKLQAQPLVPILVLIVVQRLGPLRIPKDIYALHLCK